MPSSLVLWLTMDLLARKQCSLNQLSLMFTVSYQKASFAVQSLPPGQMKAKSKTVFKISECLAIEMVSPKLICIKKV